MKSLQVVCAIILKKEKVLVAQRSEKMNLPLKWEFPGGKIKPNESEEDCIHRELKEELNINVEVIKKLNPSYYDYGEIKINLTPYVVSYKNGDIILAEHNEVRWVAQEELPMLDWASADIPVLKQFLDLKAIDYKK